MHTYRKPGVRPVGMPRGVTARVMADGSLKFYVTVSHQSVTYHVGTFDRLEDAAVARRIAERELPAPRDERELARAFVAIRRQGAGLWHMRGLTEAEQIAKITAIDPHVRMMVLRWVPLEDDPIYAVLSLMADGSTTLDMVARLYGCTRERIRQIEECATTKIKRLGYIDHYRDYARLESQTPLEVIVGGVW